MSRGAGPAARESEPATQRLDKWLWFARVTKSRTLAAELVASGKVRLNRDKIDKPSQTVRPGDVLTVGLGARVRVLEVVAAGRRRGPATEASTLYRDLAPPAPAKPGFEAPASREAGSGRPTKRDRRAIDRFTGEQ
jgi:ribosome-associated heat shock protein Hsp15